MAKKIKELGVGDYVIPLIPGIMDLGDPPFEIMKIDEDEYTITQQIGTYKSTLILSSSKVRPL